MKVSVVVCTYSADLFEDCREAVGSVLSGTYDDVEVIVVVDGDRDLYERLDAAYDDEDRVRVTANDKNLGLSASRNRGIDVATGEVVAFLDDDAVADERWIEELVRVYEETDAIAVGGKQVGDWVAGRPDFLPEEFDWLVGVTQPGFADPGEEVRNTYGSNISVRREVLEELDGFDPEVGRRGSLDVQAEEPVLGERMRAKYGRGVVYNPDAVIAHKVFEYRTQPTWLMERAFLQGYSKRAMESLVSDSGGEESEFLRRVAFDSVPRRLKGLLTRPTLARAKQLFFLWLFTATVGVGYVYATLRSWITR